MAIYNLRGEHVIPQHTDPEYEILAILGKTENDKMNAEAFEMGISRYWPAAHTEELARQVGKLLKRQIKHENIIDENERNALHQMMFESMTHAATRGAIQQSQIFASALDDSVTWEAEWGDLTTRQQRRRIKLAKEAVALHAGLVGGKSGNKRCSPAARVERREQKKGQEKYLAGRSVYNTKTGQYFSLAAPKDKLESRLAELYTIAKGLEAIIKPTEGQPPEYEWARAIVTVPAHMHANPVKGKKTWDGTLPKKAADYLADGWEKVRSRLAKFGITGSGFWTREAHQDGTPHVNFFLIFRPGAYRQVARAMKEVFGKNKRAVNIMKGDDERARRALEKKGKKPASFASYAMKYFNKNFQTEPDEDAEGEDVTASAFGYRRHGFFGLPSLTVWRELRRMRTCESDDPLIKSAWLAAHRGDAATFIQLAGGLACARSRRPLQTLRRVTLKDKTIQVVTDDPAETPFEAETETITIETSEVIGVRHVMLDALGMPYTAEAIQTRIPGIYEIIPTAEAVARVKAAQELKNPKNPKVCHQTQVGLEVTVILNCPREEAPPPPKTLKPPPCSEKEYRLATS